MTDPKEAARSTANDIIERVVKERRQSGMSVLEMAHRMGVSPTSVYRFETPPSSPTLTMFLLYVEAVGSRVAVVDVEEIERRVEQRFMNGTHE